MRRFLITTSDPYQRPTIACMAEHRSGTRERLQWRVLHVRREKVSLAMWWPLSGRIRTVESCRSRDLRSHINVSRSLQVIAWTRRMEEHAGFLARKMRWISLKIHYQLQTPITKNLCDGKVEAGWSGCLFGSLLGACEQLNIAQQQHRDQENLCEIEHSRLIFNFIAFFCTTQQPTNFFFSHRVHIVKLHLQCRMTL